MNFESHSIISLEQLSIPNYIQCRLLLIFYTFNFLHLLPLLQIYYENVTFLKFPLNPPSKFKDFFTASLYRDLFMKSSHNLGTRITDFLASDVFPALLFLSDGLSRHFISVKWGTF